MEALNVKDLVPGEIYQCHEIFDDADGIQKELEIVFKFKEHTDDPDRAHSNYTVSTIIHVNERSNITKSFRKESDSLLECTPWITRRNCRPATLMEKQWLMRSVMEDKYTEKPIKMTEPISFISKQQTELVVDDFYHGQMFEGEINHNGNGFIHTEGKITVEGKQIYLCQNIANGDSCNDYQGYEYSYGLVYYGKLQLDNTENGVKVRNLKIQSKTPSFENLAKSGNILTMTWYANIVGLEDPADDRLMMNFTSDFEFVGFSKQNKGPIFKIKNTGQSETYWYENVISKITEMGGMIKMISEQELVFSLNDNSLDSYIKQTFE